MESFRAGISFICHLVVILIEVLFLVEGGVLEMIKDSGGRSPLTMLNLVAVIVLDSF